MALNTTAAYAVEEPTQVAVARRAVTRVAEHLGFSDVRAGQVALIVSELGSNLVKHAVRGEILLRVLRAADGAESAPGIEVVALDRGPGIPDAALARQDGYSTTGTLGHGIGAVERQADFSQIYSQPSGTVMVAHVWQRRMDPVVRPPLYEVGAVRVPYPGEEVSGDDWDCRLGSDRLSMIVADGLGHGVAAHEAARAATAIYDQRHEQSPAHVIEEVHAALRATRGAAVAMVAIDLERAVARYCGLGNITGALVSPSGARLNMVSQNGAAGHVASRVREFAYPVPARAVIVMASDGLTSHWDLGSYPGVLTKHPSIMAAILYRDFSRRRDDVTVVVAKPLNVSSIKQ